MKEFLEIGKIVAAHGIRGEVRVQPWCDGPAFLENFDTLYFEGGKTPVEVERVRTHKNMAILKLKGTENIDAANALRGKMLWCRRGDVQLEERTFFVQDLIGLRVVDADDPAVEYGRLTDVSATGANDVYAVEKDGRTWLIPAIRQVIVSTELEEGIMRIRPLKGLFDDAD